MCLQKLYFTKNIDDVDLEKEVSHLEKDNLFPEYVNINIAEIVSADLIKMKTWERGAGSTKACGTGACATAFAGYRLSLVNNKVTTELPGGLLEILISENDDIYMKGAAELELSKVI